MVVAIVMGATLLWAPAPAEASCPLCDSGGDPDWGLIAKDGFALGALGLGVTAAVADVVLVVRARPIPTHLGVGEVVAGSAMVGGSALLFTDERMLRDPGATDVLGGFMLLSGTLLAARGVWNLSMMEPDDGAGAQLRVRPDLGVAALSWSGRF